MTTAEIQRVFWKDAAIMQSYTLATSSFNLLECASKKRVMHSAVLARLAAPSARKVVLKNAVGKAAKSLVSVQVLRSLRPMSMTLAVAGSTATAALLAAAPCAVAPQAKPAVAVAKLLSTALVAGVQYSAEYSMFLKAKSAIRSNGSVPTGSSKDLAIAFVAGCVAATASTVAVSMLPGRGLGVQAIRKIGASAAAGGLGYASMDKAFQVLYLPVKKMPAGSALGVSRSALPTSASSLALAAMEEHPVEAEAPLGLRVALPAMRKKPIPPRRVAKSMGAASKPGANAFTEVHSAINARNAPKHLPKASPAATSVKAPLRITYGRKRSFAKLPKA